MTIRQSFCDELLKLADDKEEKVPARPPPLLNRALQGMIGAGATAMQLPLIPMYARGRANVYHGTSLDSANKILNSIGIDPSFAGVGFVETGENLGQDIVQRMFHQGRQGRLNRRLMSDSLGRLLESAGVPMSEKDYLDSSRTFNRKMNEGSKAGEAAQYAYEQLSEKMLKDGRLTQESAAALNKKLQADLPRFGHRVYAGIHPVDLIEWGSDSDELGIIGRAVLNQAKEPQQKRMIDAVISPLTGSLGEIIRDNKKRMAYKPSDVQSMTLDQARSHLSKLHDSGDAPRVVFGASVPTGNMGYLEDFPVMRRALELNPGLRKTIASLGFPTNEPGRDLSFPHEIPVKNINQIDLIDEAGKVSRINISDAIQATRSPVLQRLKKLIIPSAIAGWGLRNIYRSIKPRERMVSPDSPYAISKEASVWSDIEFPTKAVAGWVGTGALLGGGSNYLMEKIIPPQKAETTAEKAKEEAKATLRVLGSAAISGAAGALVGRSLGRAMIAEDLDPLVTDKKEINKIMLGAMAGVGALGASTSAPFAAAREAARYDPQSLSPVPLPGKVEDAISEHPSLGLPIAAAVAAGVPIGTMYTLRKYYPSLFFKARRAIKRI